MRKKPKVFILLTYTKNTVRLLPIYKLDRLMYWQLLDNEKHVQCSESPTTTAVKELTPRDNPTASLTRTMSMLIRTHYVRK